MQGTVCYRYLKYLKVKKWKFVSVTWQAGLYKTYIGNLCLFLKYCTPRFGTYVPARQSTLLLRK
jgi:hypothetical protein